jgi:processive 1,2-diacylglycerol beta-glucosyltransferase
LKNMYRFIEGLVYKNSKVMEKLIWHYGIPDLIVSIQPEVNVVARFFKSWFASPFHTVIIDLAIHGLWVNEHIDKYYVANQPLKYDLIKFGVPESRTIVSGMPLRDGFSTVARKSVRAIRAKLGLSLVHRTVLFVGGLLGKMLDFEGAFKSIADLKIPLQVLAVFGENDTAFKRAAVLKASYKYPMHLWRTVNNMHELIWASDVVVSKPGSMTMAEVMSLGKPLIAINPLAGSAQELRFASFLEENGAGMWIRDVKELGVALRDVVTSKTKYNQISKNAQALGKYGLDANKIIFASIKRSFADKEE